MGKRETSNMSRPILLFCSMLLCLALVSAGRSSSSSPPPPPSQSGRCIASSPSNSGDGCTTESDCGNSDATKFFCQTTDSYAGRRRRKGGKCITGSPQNAGEDCFNSESDCGGTDSTTYCQETLVQTTHPGRCIASSPSNEGDGCATESDCGNSDATKFFCQTTDSYAGRRRRKGGKYITGSPQNAGEDCFNSESDCGNTDPTKFFCQATLAESDTCDDWDPTKKGMVKAGLEGYAQCGGKAGTKECWNAWCENNCGNGDHPACVLDDTVEGAVDIHTRCKCDVEMMIEWFNDDAAPQSLTQTEDKWSESK